MMDLSQFDTEKAAEQGALCHLVNPATNEKLYQDDKSPVGIQVHGSDSSKYRKAQRTLNNKRLENQFKKRSQKITMEQLEEDSLELLVAVTVGWQGIVVDGEPLEFSEKNCRELYTRFTWIREQVDEFVTDRSNFLGNS